jgi:hypothetical protein
MIHKQIYATKRKGFRLYLMRWQYRDGRKGKLGGIGIRAFGRRVEIYTDGNAANGLQGDS